MTNHTAKTVDTSTELEPLNPDNSTADMEKSSSGLHSMANGFCDNSENIYGNILGSPSGKELKTGIDIFPSANGITTKQEENEENGETPRYRPLQKYIYIYIYTYIYPPLCFELLMRTKALLLQFRALFPDICEVLCFWAIAGGCPDKHFGHKSWHP